MHETSTHSFEQSLTRALQHALGHLSAVDATPVRATAALAQLRETLDVQLADSGLPPQQVLDELVAASREGLHGTQSGRFFGWVIGGSLPAALAADWMVSAWDQNAGVYATSPAAAVVEETAGRWLKQLLHIPEQASFAFVTGCQMAHVTCLAAARHALLTRAGWDFVRNGLSSAPVIRVLTGSQHHATIPRAIRLLGLGEGNIISLPVQEDGRVPAEALLAELEREPSRPTIVVLQAGDVNTGVSDDFATLIPLARLFGAWVHIDGAFGLWAAASHSHRHFVAGAELADSWATDGHKWLNVPYDCGYAFVADDAAHRAAFTHQAAYVAHHEAARDALDWNAEYSRRARGFATYAALRQLGRSGVEELVDRCCSHARALVTRIGAAPGAEVLAQATLNQGLLRFLAPQAGASDDDHAQFTDRMIEAIDASGEALFSGTTWRGRRAMRVSVSGWQTTDAHVDRVVAAVLAVLARERAVRT